MLEDLHRTLPPLMSIGEAAEVLRVNVRTIKRMIFDGRLTQVKISGVDRTFVTKESVLGAIVVVPPPATTGGDER